MTPKCSLLKALGEDFSFSQFQYCYPFIIPSIITPRPQVAIQCYCVRTQECENSKLTSEEQQIPLTCTKGLSSIL